MTPEPTGYDPYNSTAGAQYVVWCEVRTQPDRRSHERVQLAVAQAVALRRTPEFDARTRRVWGTL